MSKKTVIKAHPVYVYKFLKRFLFVLVLPVLKGAVQYILYRTVSGVLMLEGIALAAITALAIARVLCFGVSVKNGNLYIEDGIFFRKKSVIPVNHLSNITVMRHFLLDIIGAVSVSVNTEAGLYGKKDFEFMLYRKDAEALESIIYGKKPQIEVRFPARRIALLSASVSSSLTGLLVGVPIINQTGKLFNVGISRILSDITALGRSIKSYFPPIVNIITILFLAVYGLSFAVALARNFFFRIAGDDEKIEIMSGLYFRKRRIFKKNAINNLCIDQTPLMHLFKTYTMRVSIGGYGGEKGERSTVIPAMKKSLIKSRFFAQFPLLAEKGEFLTPEKDGITKQRFLLLPHIYTLIILAVGAISVLIFPAFDRFVLFLVLAALMFTGYYGYVSVRAQRLSGISLEKTVIAKCTAGMTVRELYVKSEKIGKIKIFRTPADKRLGTCKLTLTVRSESSDKAKVRNIPYGAAREKLEKLYGIKL